MDGTVRFFPLAFCKLMPNLEEFAALSGLPGGRNTSPLDTHKVRSISKKTLPSDTTGGRATHDPNDDDAPLSFRPSNLGHSQRGSGDTIMGFANNRTGANKLIGGSLLPSHHGLANSNLANSPQVEYLTSVPHVVASPKITVRAEHTSVCRNADREKKTNITCMISIEMPSRLDRGMKQRLSNVNNGSTNGPLLPDPSLSDADSPRDLRYHPDAGREASEVTAEADYPSSSTAYSVDGHSDPFEHIVKDLTDRMADWKGHSPKDFGKLHMYDLLHVRKDKKM
jgi:hypothetical protein